jgi:type VI secretion system secreted protein Hcp
MAIFAKYDGIDGESTNANHAAWVDVLSLDWGATHATSLGAAGGRRRSSAMVEEMVLSLHYEKAAPKLLEKCLEGAVIPRLEIEVTATYGGTRVTYLRYELENVVVASYHVHAPGNDEAGPPTVVVANGFEEIKVTYTEFGDDGSAAGNIETEHVVERSAAQPKGKKQQQQKKKKKKKKNTE